VGYFGQQLVAILARFHSHPLSVTPFLTSRVVPFMAQGGQRNRARVCPLSGGDLNRSTQHWGPTGNK